MTTSIHPTAIVSQSAKLGSDVQIGPFAIINDDAEIGDRSVIHAHAIVGPRVIMGAANQVHSFSIIGALPQDLSFDPATPTGVLVGDNNDFRESVTVSSATRAGEYTRIGSNCFFMNNSHAAHDCVLGDRNILANGAALGGHVQLGDKVFFGAGAMAHQFCRVGSYAMVAALIGVRKDVLPYSMVGGSPVLHYRLNTIGLRRAGITGTNYATLNKAFRLLRNKQELAELPSTDELEYLRTWLSTQSKRGIYGFARPENKGEE